MSRFVTLDKSVEDYLGMTGQDYSQNPFYHPFCVLLLYNDGLIS